MKLTEVNIEATHQKEEDKELKFLERELSDLLELKKDFRNFDFKKEGIKMTARQFFETQTFLKNKILQLRKRRREILKNCGGKNGN